MANILIIEDRESLRRLYDTALSRLGHQVTLARSGEEGIKAARETQHDLVIMDLMLPGMSGGETAQCLRESGSLTGTPMIITTAMTAQHARQVSSSIGAASVLVKPFDIAELTAAVETALSVAVKPPHSGDC